MNLLFILVVLSTIAVWTSNGQDEDITIPPPIVGNNEVEDPTNIPGRPGAPSPSHNVPVSRPPAPEPSLLFDDLRNFKTVCWIDGVRPKPEFQSSLTCPSSVGRLTFPSYSEDCRVHHNWVGYICPYAKCQRTNCQGVRPNGISAFTPRCVPSDKLTLYYWLDCRHTYRRRSVTLPQCCSCQYN